MLDSLADLCEFDPFLVLLFGIVTLAALLAVLVLVVIWPLEPRIDDPMDHPFGDMPTPPREWQ